MWAFAPLLREPGAGVSLRACNERRARAITSAAANVCIEGPAFSTLAESKLYRSWGMDLVGLTNLQEARPRARGEICYATLAMVTDYDCWHPDHDAVTRTRSSPTSPRTPRRPRPVLTLRARTLAGSRRGCECARRPQVLPGDGSELVAGPTSSRSSAPIVRQVLQESNR